MLQQASTQQSQENSTICIKEAVVKKRKKVDSVGPVLSERKSLIHLQVESVMLSRENIARMMVLNAVLKFTITILAPQCFEMEGVT